MIYTYAGCACTTMIKVQLCNIMFDGNISISESKKDGKSVPAPSSVLETLRVTLSEYKKRLDDTTEEVSHSVRFNMYMYYRLDRFR